MEEQLKKLITKFYITLKKNRDKLTHDEILTLLKKTIFVTEVYRLVSKDSKALTNQLSQWQWYFAKLTKEPNDLFSQLMIPIISTLQMEGACSTIKFKSENGDESTEDILSRSGLKTNIKKHNNKLTFILHTPIEQLDNYQFRLHSINSLNEFNMLLEEESLTEDEDMRLVSALIDNFLSQKKQDNNNNVISNEVNLIRNKSLTPQLFEKELNRIKTKYNFSELAEITSDILEGILEIKAYLKVLFKTFELEKMTIVKKVTFVCFNNTIQLDEKLTPFDFFISSEVSLAKSNSKSYNEIFDLFKNLNCPISPLTISLILCSNLENKFTDLKLYYSLFFQPVTQNQSSSDIFCPFSLAIVLKKFRLCHDILHEFRKELIEKSCLNGELFGIINYLIQLLSFGENNDLDFRKNLNKLCIDLLEIQFSSFDQHKIPLVDQSKKILQNIKNSKTSYPRLLFHLINVGNISLLRKFSQLNSFFNIPLRIDLNITDYKIEVVSNLLAYALLVGADTQLSLEIIDCLIKDFQIPVNIASEHEWSPFISFINNVNRNQNEVLKRLLDNGLNINEPHEFLEWNELPLFFALQKKDISLENYIRLVPKNLADSEATKLFLMALTSQQLEVAQLMLNENWAINLKCIDQCSNAVPYIFSHKNEANYGLIYRALENNKQFFEQTPKDTVTFFLMGLLMVALTEDINESHKIKSFAKIGLIGEKNDENAEKIKLSIYKPCSYISEENFYTTSQYPLHIFNLLLPFSDLDCEKLVRFGDGQTNVLSMMNALCILGKANLLALALEKYNFDPNNNQSSDKFRKYFETVVSRGFSDCAELFLKNGVLSCYVGLLFKPLSIAIDNDDISTIQIILSYVKDNLFIMSQIKSTTNDSFLALIIRKDNLEMFNMFLKTINYSNNNHDFYKNLYELYTHAKHHGEKILAELKRNLDTSVDSNSNSYSQISVQMNNKSFTQYEDEKQNLLVKFKDDHDEIKSVYLDRKEMSPVLEKLCKVLDETFEGKSGRIVPIKDSKKSKYENAKYKFPLFKVRALEEGKGAGDKRVILYASKENEKSTVSCEGKDMAIDYVAYYVPKH